MKKIVGYLGKNNKWVISILILIWLIYIIKLFMFGLHFHIHIFNWFIEYYWTNAWYISIIFFIISIICIFIIKNIANNIIKIYIAFLIFLLWIFWKSFFYLISPDFKFYFTNIQKEYIDSEWYLIDIDLYLYYMWKYCDNSIDNLVFKRVHREDLCAWQYIVNFRTVEEYKKAFNYANENNMRYLYKLTFYWSEDFWLEKIIEEYNDDTFYWYVIDKTSNLKLLQLINNNLKNKELLEILENNIISIKYFYENKELFNNKQWYKYWNKLSDSFINNIKNIKEINYKIF